MYLVELWRSLRRRWWIVLIGLVATALLSVGMYRWIPVSYTASAMHLLLPPPQMIDTDGDGIPDKIVDSNPYLNLGGLGQAVTILVSRLNSSAVHAQLTAGVPAGTDYTAIDDGQAAPIVEIDVSSNDSVAATRLLASVNENVQTQLALMQSELAVPSNSLITTTVLASDPQAAIVSKARLQGTLGTLVGGIILSIIAAAVVDGLAARRRNRNSASPDEVEEAAAADADAVSNSAAPAPQSEPAPDPAQPMAMPVTVVAGHAVATLDVVEKGIPNQ